MARTIQEIQDEIIVQKQQTPALDGLTSASKSAIWRLWSYITASAIWAHEKIVEQNALVSRPHNLHWYKDQALNYVKGAPLVWEDGYFQFDVEGIQDVEKRKIVSHCAVSERLFDEVQQTLQQDGAPIQNVEELISEYYYNQVGVIRMKVAKEEDDQIKRLEQDELISFRYYMNQIKDAGNQLLIESLDGDRIHLNVEVYVDPLLISVDEENPENNGRSLRDLSARPIEEAIKDYVENLEFNGAIVPTYLIDNIQQATGTKLVLLRKLEVAASNGTLSTDDSIISPDAVVIVDDDDIMRDGAFYVPSAGYFDYKKSDIQVTYKPYNLQTTNEF